MKEFITLLKKLMPFLVLALLIVIPLYPKIPLIDIKNTWVYIRAEDFFIFFVLSLWSILLIKKEVTLKTPLTVPILLFWLIGAVATIHGVVIIFPTIANVFPNIALLAYIRHIEYLSVFFVAYFASQRKYFLHWTVWTVIGVLLAVIAYGFGQKYLAFPAFLTMNEEYAKGIPVQLSQLSRIPSTFAGHYDLAAYLVLVIPIIVSLIFGFKNYLIKILLAVTSLLGVALLFMTVSRISFFVLFIALFIVFFFYKRRLALVGIPLLLIAGASFLSVQPQLLARFGDTVKEVNVLIDAASGNPIGHVEYVPVAYLQDKLLSYPQVADQLLLSTPSAEFAPIYGANSVMLPEYLPEEIPVVKAVITSNGETLPQGSEYINLPLSPVTNRFSLYFVEPERKDLTQASTLRVVRGDYLVKRASAYDISFTTRFQGEWPHTFSIFLKNIWFGGGYGSVSLAVDNNFLRILGETGILGFASFIILFVAFGLFIKKAIPTMESKLLKSFVLGLSAGIVGLALNAVFIDVFEASKIAFQLWILIGIAVGTVAYTQKEKFDLYAELKSAATGKYAVISYLVIFSVVLYAQILNNYFTGDDFTWFRWIADCNSFIQNTICSSKLQTITHYLFNSDGFFYRPGTKTYFSLMYPIFWLNQAVYHGISIVLHVCVVVLLYLLARKVLKDNMLSSLVMFMYVIASSYVEAIVWISSTGYLFTAIFMLLSVHLFILFNEKKGIIFLLLSMVSAFASMLFHEMGIVTPLVILAYQVTNATVITRQSIYSALKRSFNFLLLTPVILYLGVRIFSNSHWLNGDYSYNLLKFPLNFVGNSFGYIMLSLTGPISMPLYEKLRFILRENLVIGVILSLIILVVSIFVVKFARKITTPEEKRVIIFASLFFIILLLPFIGLGNIAFRYSYLSSFGVFILFALFIRKLFVGLQEYGRDVAFLSIATFIAVFSLFHIIQLQQSLIDWRRAGEKVQNFFTTIEGSYNKSWSEKQVSLYFLNVPIKNNDAWVFPVGLKDALWFAFGNPNMRVIQVARVEDIPPTELYSDQTWVFTVQEDGNVKRIPIKRPILLK